MEDIEKRVIGKVMWRLIPFLILCYFVAYLDRVNVGFAKLHMNQALGLSEAVRHPAHCVRGCSTMFHPGMSLTDNWVLHTDN